MQKQHVIYSKKAANTLLLLAFVAGVLFLHSYLGIFALAALTALLFTPVHDWFLRRKGRIAKASTGLTMVVVLLTFLLPFVAFIGLSFYEAEQVIDDLKTSHAINQDEVGDLSTRLTNTANGLGIDVSKDTVTAKIQEITKKIIPGLLSFIYHTTGSIARTVTDAIVYIVLLALMLSRKYQLIRAFRRFSPLDESVTNEYLDKVRAMAISMVKGTFIIAVVVGFISAMSLWVIGFPYIAFWFLLFTLMSLIPLGAGIIYVPIGIILLLTGNTWQGILILLVQFVVLNNVDNILRPRLASKGNKLPGSLVLISTFAGVSFFGLVGVVYGPTIMVLIYTTFELYDRHLDSGFPLKRAIA